ncbi:hypothetical protein BDZ45DRAFT_257968 [Acephala macrosclerotiorum]|nr:hypothetical protein BDZ45DRAFT_257968 [Acephala macrosclerotiorum]
MIGSDNDSDMLQLKARIDALTQEGEQLLQDNSIQHGQLQDYSRQYKEAEKRQLQDTQVHCHEMAIIKSQADEMACRLQKEEVHNEKLQITVMTLRDNVSNLESISAVENQNFRAKMDALRDQTIRQLEAAERQTAVFRNIILKGVGAGMEQIDDTTVIEQFRSLRDQILRIVMKDCRMENIGLDAGHSTLQKLQQAGRSIPELQGRLQGLLFDNICQPFLLQRVFGLEGMGGSNELEDGLNRFEAALGLIGLGT